MRVLLTGSSGWLGRHLAPLLEESGHKVTGLDVAPGAYTNKIGTIADRPFVNRVIADCGIEAIIHACGLHKPDIARFLRQAFIDVNVTGTLNLLEAPTVLAVGSYLRICLSGCHVWWIIVRLVTIVIDPH